jgi:hypothetical protein
LNAITGGLPWISTGTFMVAEWPFGIAEDAGWDLDGHDVVGLTGVHAVCGFADSVYPQMLTWHSRFRGWDEDEEIGLDPLGGAEGVSGNEGADLSGVRRGVDAEALEPVIARRLLKWPVDWIGV